MLAFDGALLQTACAWFSMFAKDIVSHACEMACSAPKLPEFQDMISHLAHRLSLAAHDKVSWARWFSWDWARSVSSHSPLDLLNKKFAVDCAFDLLVAWGQDKSNHRFGKLCNGRQALLERNAGSPYFRLYGLLLQYYSVFSIVFLISSRRVQFMLIWIEDI